MTATPINWPELKAMGYAIDRSSMWGREGDMWFFYNHSKGWSGSRVKTKGEAMRACRDHFHSVSA